MNSQAEPAQSLNYFQQSPVRGQLEPSDGFVRVGWRYLQCTDTPGELRVLLPPRTALIYSHLLKAETMELTKGKDASWARIMDIRHLKDRMIRKSSRLAKDSTSKGKTKSQMVMVTVHAPPDFRLKEMERWYRSQSQEFLQAVSDGSSTRPFCCSVCGPLGAHISLSRQNTTSTRTSRSSAPRGAVATRTPRSVTPTRTPAGSNARATTPTRNAPRAANPNARANVPPSRPRRMPDQVPVKAPSGSSDTIIEPPTVSKARTPTPEAKPEVKQLKSALSQAHDANVVPAVIRQSDSPPPPPSKTVSPQRSVDSFKPPSSRVSADARVEPHPPRALMQSPDPLPIPYRSSRPRRPASELESEPEEPPIEIPLVANSPVPISEDLPSVEKSPSPASTLVNSAQNEPAPVPSFSQPLETIHENPEGSEISTQQRPIVRRRSSLKRRDSMSRLSVASQSKSVTWAMDNDWKDQMDRFVKSTNEAKLAAEELDKIRDQYFEEIAMMRIICHDCTVAAERLGVDTDVWNRQINALQEQENKVVALSDHLERKENVHKDKVLAVLQETQGVVSLCEKKRARDFSDS